MVEINARNARSWSRFGARATYGAAMLALAGEHPNVYAASADLVSSSGLERFARSYPERVVNTGISEQNLIGVAAGMAKEGAVVFASSFAPFISLRAGEPLRMNLGYMQMNVKAVALGSGVSMAHLGNSHYGLEDMAVMRAIPGLTVLCPADGAEIHQAVFAAAAHQGPVYLRLTGAAPLPVVYQEDYSFEIGKAITLRRDALQPDIALIACGSMVYHALEAAALLAEQGKTCAVVNMHTVKPLDTGAIDDLLGAKQLVTVEEHSAVGGLGAAVAEYLAPLPQRPPHTLLGLPDTFGKSGSYEWLLERYGLTGSGIAAFLSKGKSE